MLSKNSPKQSIWVISQFGEVYDPQTVSFEVDISNSINPFASCFGKGEIKFHESKLIFYQEKQNIAFVVLNELITFQQIEDKEKNLYCIQLNKSLKSSYLSLDYQSYIRVSDLLKDFIFKLDFYSQYAFISTTGGEEFSQVSQVQKIRTEQKYTAKTIQKTIINGSVIKKKQFMNEVKLLRNLNHPQIIKGQDYFESDNVYKIIMKYYEGQTLSLKLKQLKMLTLQEICSIMLQIMRGIQYMHQKNIIHRKLNFDAIQFLDQTNQNIILTGLNYCQNLNEEFIPLEELNNHDFIAPEIISSNKGKDHNKMTDIYACGAIFYQLAVGLPLVSEKYDVLGKCEQKQIKNRFDIEEMYKLPSTVQFLIQSMLELQPEKRPTVEEIVIKIPFLLSQENKNLQCYFKLQKPLLKKIVTYNKCRSNISQDSFISNDSNSSEIPSPQKESKFSSSMHNSFYLNFSTLSKKSPLKKQNTSTLSERNFLNKSSIEASQLSTSHSPIIRSNSSKLNKNKSVIQNESLTTTKPLTSSLFKSLKQNTFFSK